MGKDWADGAAELLYNGGDHGEHYNSSPEDIASVIRRFAEPLVVLLQKSKREHYHCGDEWYCCGKCLHPDHAPENDTGWPATHHGEAARESGVCNCGADDLNAKIDAVLNG